MTKFSLWKISLLTFICTQSTDLGQIPDIKNLQKVLFLSLLFIQYAFDHVAFSMVWIIFINKLRDVAKDLKVQILLSNESVPLKKVIHFCSNFWKTCPKKLCHPPLLPTSSIREVLLPRYRQMNADTMDSVTCLGTERTFPSQISCLGTTCLISLGINKQQETRVRS